MSNEQPTTIPDLEQQAVDVATLTPLSLYQARGLVQEAYLRGVGPLALVALVTALGEERVWRHAPMAARVQECYRRLAQAEGQAGREEGRQP